jgi:hypothetical protein
MGLLDPPAKLAKLSDVDLAGAVDGDPLLYDAVSGGARKGSGGVLPDISKANDAEIVQFDAAAAKAIVDSLPTLRIRTLLWTAAPGASPSNPQGMCWDGTYLYWGNNNGAGAGTIYKIDPATGSVLASWAGPHHCPNGSYRANRGTQLWSTWDGGTPNAVQELTGAGVLVRTYDFSTLTGGLTGGCMFAWDDSDPNGDTGYLLTCSSSSSTANTRVNRVQLHDDGTWTDLGVVLGSTGLGVPEGLQVRNGKLYLLTEDPTVTASNLRVIYRWSLIAGALVQDRKWGYITNFESQGICFVAGQLYQGDSQWNFWTSPWASYNDRTVTGGLYIIGPAYPGTDKMGRVQNTTPGKATRWQIDAVSGQDAILSLLNAGSTEWSMKNLGSSNVWQLVSGASTVHVTVDASGRMSLGGPTAPVASAVLDLSQSTTMGFLPPKVTTTQKNAISSPAEGLVVYDTTLHKLCVYTGAAWETVTSA